MSNGEHNEDELLFPVGNRYAGQPIDNSSRRSIQARQENVTLETLRQQELVEVDYFFHLGKFWTAQIPLTSIKEIRGQSFNFSKRRMRKGKDGPEMVKDRFGVPKGTISCLTHVQCRVILEEGVKVRLFELGESTSAPPVHEIDDFVYTIEAVGPRGTVFNLRDGITGHLVTAHRFVSTEEMVFERIVVENQYLAESGPLKLSAEQRSETLRRAIYRSHIAADTERYYLFRLCGTNNCTSNPFQIVDRVVAYRLTQRIGAMLYRLPINPRFYLRVRGLDSDPSMRRLVRDEFEAFITRKDIQARKRDVVRARIRQKKQKVEEGGEGI